jgi:Protein of unknown function, DUF481
MKAIFRLFYLIILGFGIGLNAATAQEEEPAEGDTLDLGEQQEYIQNQVDSIVAAKMDSIHHHMGLISKPVNPLYSIGSDGNFTWGNVDRALWTARGKLEFTTGKILKFGSYPQFVYGTKSGQLLERDWMADIHASFFYQDKVYEMLFGSVEASNLRKIELRYIAGLGAGWQIKDVPAHYLSLTSALIYEYTDFIGLDPIQLLRSSSRILGVHKLKNNHIILRYNYLFQPSINRNNVRWNGMFSVESPINRWVRLRSSLECSYESLVVFGKQNYDWRLTFGFVIGNG